MGTMELEGHIIEFIDSGSLRVGYVRKHERSRLQVVDRRGRQSSALASKVVIIHGPTREDEFSERAVGLIEEVEEIRAEIDLELLWESVKSEQRDFTIAELAEAYFGERSPISESALFRALDAKHLFFKKRGTEFRPRSETQVTTERVRNEREQENEQFRLRVSEMLRLALREPEPPDDPEWSMVADRLYSWLRQGGNDEVGQLLEDVLGEPRAKSAAYDLLVKAGRLDPSEDRFLLINGVNPHFSEDTLKACAELKHFENDPSRVDRANLPALAIDDDDTREVDDALTIDEVNGETVVGIHIADVSFFAGIDGPLDREAFRRSSTLYLPNLSVMMFPERLGTDLASLKPGQIRPAFTIEVRFDSGNKLLGFEIFQSVVRVAERMSYEEADRSLASGNPTLARLEQIAFKLLEARKERGASVHHRPELKVRVKGDEISIRRIDTNSPTRLIVSEMMILANRLGADHAAAEDIPIVFRTQEPPDEAPPQTDGLPEPLQFERLRKTFKRSRLSLAPGQHSGLGLSAYSQMSSPIRRYVDLVTQRQIAAAQADGHLPYDREELLKILTTAEATELEVRRLEEASTNYWVLEYLSRVEMKRPLQALVLNQRGTLELTEYLVRGRASGLESPTPGDYVTVEIESIHPRKAEIRFRRV